MPRPTLVIARAVLRLWLREVARVLAVPTRRIVAALVAVGCCAVALGALLALAASSNLPAELPAEMRSAVLGTSFGGAALTAGALGVALCAASPPRTALTHLLALLPVGPVAARLGQLLPTLALGLGYTLPLSGTAAVVVVRTSPAPLPAALGLVALLGVVVVSLLLATAVFSLVETAAAQALRLPHAYATGLAGAVALAATFAATLPDVLLPPSAPGAAPTPSAFLPPRAFAALAADPGALDAAPPVLWTIVALALTTAAAALHRPAGPPRRLVVPRGTRPLRRSPGWGLLWSELLLLVRTPQVVLVALLLPLAVAAVTLLAGVPLGAPLVPSLAGAVVLLPALVGLTAPGRTLPHDWAVDVVTARPAARLIPQVAAVAFVTAALAIPTAAALLLFGLLEPSALGGVALRGVLALALALACGAVVPWSEQQPLSATAGALLFAVASLALALGLSAASTAAGSAVEPALVLLAAALAIGVYASARLRPAGRIGAA